MKNKDLIKSILILDGNANTDGLSNVELTALLKKLKEDDGEVITPDVEEIKAPPYSIAKGKAVTTMIGMLSHGDEIKAEHLGGGQKSLDALVELKVVVKA